jgi:2-amino-4-hydroxy-6-hydroxymethyldihydropteridine diphosphokinase
VRTGRTESRPIDLDVLIYAGVTRAGPRLVLPHPRMRERAFVLLPLAEIAPDEMIEGRTAADWAARLPASGIRGLA